MSSAAETMWEILEEWTTAQDRHTHTQHTHTRLDVCVKEAWRIGLRLSYRLMLIDALFLVQKARIEAKGKQRQTISDNLTGQGKKKKKGGAGGMSEERGGKQGSVRQTQNCSVIPEIPTCIGGVSFRPSDPPLTAAPAGKEAGLPPQPASRPWWRGFWPYWKKSHADRVFTCMMNSRRLGIPLSESSAYSGSFSFLAC